jgi:iron complex outermembrane receptor protein
MQKSRLISGLPPSLLALTLVAPHGAVAEDATQGSNGNSAVVLEEVIVTAQKRSEDVQSVPMSVSVVGQEQLDDLHATQIADYAGYVPGLQVQTNGSPAQATLSLRGISPLSSSSTVSTYIDDTPLGSSSLYGGSVGSAQNVLDLLPFDFDNFEVLRGPQGTLYGASALGGLIKYASKAPDLNQVSILAGADAFSLDHAGNPGAGGHFRVSVPLIPGQLGVSASFAREDTPGYIDNSVTGTKDQNSYRQQAFRVAVLWEPIDVLSVSLSAIKQDIHSDDDAYVAVNPATLSPFGGRYQNNNYVPQPFIQELNYFTGTVSWDLGWADLKSAASYSRTTTDETQDATPVYGDIFGGVSAFESHLSLYKTTEELRLTSKSDDHIEWLVGGFYTRENSINSQVATAQGFDGTPVAGLDPLAVVGLPSTYEEYAAFGDFTYKFNASFDATAGLRWAHNNQTFTQITGGAAEAPSDVPGSSSQGVVTYSVSPRWHITSDTMAYVRVASGYQPGGPNLALPGVPPTVGSSKLTNYELGVKSFLDQRRLVVDLSAFYIGWKDIQVSGTNGVNSYIVNGGTASSEGFELSTEYMPIEGLRFGLNAAYTDAKLTEDVPVLGGVSGDELPYSPRWSGSFTADDVLARWGADWTARAGAGLRFDGARESYVNHSPLAVPLKAYEAVDLNADVSNEHYTFRFFVKNLTNKYVFTTETALTNAATGTVDQITAVPLQPREIGVGFDVKY